MSIWQEFDLQVGPRKLYVRRTGGHKPPLVLLHGLTSTSETWTRTAEVLRGDYDVIAYDARGHGQSDRSDGHFSEQDRVDDLLGVLDALGLEKVALIGHSMGGVTAAQFAAQQPERVRALVLEDPAFVIVTPEQQAERGEMAKKFAPQIEFILTAPEAEALAKAREMNPHWDEADLPAWLRSMRQVEGSMFALFSRSIAPDWQTFTRQIQCPWLLLSGDVERGGIITGSQAAELLAANPQAQHLHLSGAGHSLRFEQFSAFVGAVQAFLRQAEPVQAG